MARIAELGCIACSLDGIPGTPAEVHHIRHQGGRKHFLTIPLCPPHHRGDNGTVSVHGSPKKFKMLYGDELDLLNLTLERFYD
jgi:hypothetical protein